MNSRVIKYFFHSATTATTLTDASTPTSMAVGECGIFKQNLKGLAAGDTFERGDVDANSTEAIVVVQKIGADDYYQSQPIAGYNITSIKFCPYAAPTVQVTRHSVATGTAPDGEYSLSIYYKYDEELFGERPHRVMYTHNAVGQTYAQVMTALANLINADKRIRRAVTALADTSGGQERITLTAIQPIGEPANIHPLRRLQACEVTFESFLVGPLSTVVGTKTAVAKADTGKGTEFMMWRAEDFAKGWMGHTNKRKFPVIAPRYFSSPLVGFAGWSTVIIEHRAEDYTTENNVGNEYKQAPLTTVLAFRENLSGAAKTALLGGFNTFIQSCPGEFDTV